MITALEARLAELDPILQEFCSRRGIKFDRLVGVWPRRKVWAREDIDRVMDLTMDFTVPEFLQRGFQSNMPWSLYASASLPVSKDYPPHILSLEIFRHVPFSSLADILPARLEDGLTTLRNLKREDVLTRGKIHGSA